MKKFNWDLPADPDQMCIRDSPMSLCDTDEATTDLMVDGLLTKGSKP